MATSTPQIGLKRYLGFVGVVTIAHVVTYLVAGTLAYQFIYKSAMATGEFDPALRSPDNPEEWQHVLNWLLPAQVLRGALYGVALCPLLTTLATWHLRSRFCTLFVLLLVCSVWSVTMPAAGSIEGWVYLRPGSGPSLPNPLLGYLEVPMQLAVFSLLVSWWIGRQTNEK